MNKKKNLIKMACMVTLVGTIIVGSMTGREILQPIYPAPPLYTPNIYDELGHSYWKIQNQTGEPLVIITDLITEKEEIKIEDGKSGNVYRTDNFKFAVYKLDKSKKRKKTPHYFTIEDHFIKFTLDERGKLKVTSWSHIGK